MKQEDYIVDATHISVSLPSQERELRYAGSPGDGEASPLKNLPKCPGLLKRSLSDR
jgi:hypothetical protein